MVKTSVALLVCGPETEHVDFLEHRGGTKWAPFEMDRYMLRSESYP